MTKTYHDLFKIVSNFSGLIFRLLFRLPLVFALSGCAYHLTGPNRSLPQGYHQMSVPIFKNYSQEVGVEVSFTNSFIQEFRRSQVAKVVDPAQAEVVIEGEIRSIGYTGSGKIDLVTKDTKIATGPVLATAYDIAVVVGITVRRLSDKTVLWAGEFNRTTTYSAPQVTLAGINTVNPLYNLSARRQTIDSMANDMMAEAHDRITENF